MHNLLRMAALMLCWILFPATASAYYVYKVEDGFDLRSLNNTGNIIVAGQSGLWLVTSAHNYLLGWQSSYSNDDYVLTGTSSGTSLWNPVIGSKYSVPANFIAGALGNGGVIAGFVPGREVAVFKSGSLTVYPTPAVANKFIGIFGVNSSGMVVGTTNVSDDGGDALLLTAEGSTNLSRVPNVRDSNSYAFDVSDQGRVLGHDTQGTFIWSNGTYITTNESYGGSLLKFTASGDFISGDKVYRVDGSIVNAKDLIPAELVSNFASLLAINTLGDIAIKDKQGNTLIISDSKRTYVPFVVPEPNEYALLLGGLCLLGWMVHRRKRDSATSAS